MLSLARVKENQSMLANSKSQVSPTATEAELKKAYKVNALKYHPGMHHPTPISVPQNAERCNGERVSLGY